MSSATICFNLENGHSQLQQTTLDFFFFFSEGINKRTYSNVVVKSSHVDKLCSFRLMIYNIGKEDILTTWLEYWWMKVTLNVDNQHRVTLLFC